MKGYANTVMPPRFRPPKPVEPHGYFRARVRGCSCLTCAAAEQEWCRRRDLFLDGHCRVTSVPIIAVRMYLDRVAETYRCGNGHLGLMAHLDRGTVKAIREGRCKSYKGKPGPPMLRVNVQRAAQIFSIPLHHGAEIRLPPLVTRPGVASPAKILLQVLAAGDMDSEAVEDWEDPVALALASGQRVTGSTSKAAKELAMLRWVQSGRSQHSLEELQGWKGGRYTRLATEWLKRREVEVDGAQGDTDGGDTAAA